MAWISDGNYLPHTLVESFCTAFKKRIYALSGAFQRLFPDTIQPEIQCHRLR